MIRFLSIFVLTFVLGCGSAVTRYEPRPVEEQDITDTVVQAATKTAPPAPWELPQLQSAPTPELAAGDNYAARGALAQAMEQYRLGAKLARSRAVREEALLRIVSTHLKFGQTKRALQEVKDFSALYGIEVQDLDPRVGLVVAFAYERDADIDQALAWFALTEISPKGDGQLSRRARDELKGLIASLPKSTFEEQEAKWINHRSLGPLFEAERARRLMSGEPAPRTLAQWFQPKTYQTGANIEVHKLSVVPDGMVVVGLLAPLSGRFQPYGERVKRGVELALNEAERRGAKIALFTGDTAGSAERAIVEYNRLVTEHNVQVVLGPLLYRTSTAVGAAAEAAQVPIVSFTKREGVPELNSFVYRLGATADSQVEELLDYTSNTLNLRSYTVLYPNTRTGIELSRAFRRRAEHMGSVIFGETAYTISDPSSLRTAVERIKVRPPEGVFIADSLEAAFPLLTALYELQLESTVLLGPAAWDDAVALRGYSGLIEGAVFVTPFFSESKSPEVAEFTSLYRQEFNAEPDLLSAQAFDATRFVLRGFSGAKKVPGELLRVLRSADIFHGVTGELRADETGEIHRRMSVIRLIRGEPTEVVSKGLRAELGH